MSSTPQPGNKKPCQFGRSRQAVNRVTALICALSLIALSHNLQAQATNAREAAALATEGSNDKVLKVERKDGKYRVKLLQPSGRIKYRWLEALPKQSQRPAHTLKKNKRPKY